jgi:hypothetical protein
MLLPETIILLSLSVTAGTELEKAQRIMIVALLVSRRGLTPGEHSGQCLLERSARVPRADKTFLGDRSNQAAVMGINEPPREPPRAL